MTDLSLDIIRFTSSPTLFSEQMEVCPGLAKAFAIVQKDSDCGHESCSRKAVQLLLSDCVKEEQMFRWLHLLESAQDIADVCDIQMHVAYGFPRNRKKVLKHLRKEGFVL